MKEAQGALADRSQMLISSHIHQLKRRHPPCLPHYQASKAAQLIFKNSSIWHSHLSRLWLCMRMSNIKLPSQSAERKQRAQRLSLRVRCWIFFVIAANRHQINLTFVRKRVTVCFFNSIGTFEHTNWLELYLGDNSVRMESELLFDGSGEDVFYRQLSYQQCCLTACCQLCQHCHVYLYINTRWYSVPAQQSISLSRVGIMKMTRE